MISEAETPVLGELTYLKLLFRLTPLGPRFRRCAGQGLHRPAQHQDLQGLLRREWHRGRGGPGQTRAQSRRRKGSQTFAGQERHLQAHKRHQATARLCDTHEASEMLSSK